MGVVRLGRVNLEGLTRVVLGDPTVAAAVADARGGLPALDLAAPPSLRAFLAAALVTAQRPVLLVTSTYREAEQLTAEVASLLGEAEVAYYPAWETLPHERLSPRSDTVGRRLAVLRRLVGNDPLPPPRVVVAPVRSVLQPQVRGLGAMAPVAVRVGDDVDLGGLAQALVDAAYTRVDLVERRGEFAVRGGIVDVFPPTEEHPLRIDFFGDTVDEIRVFQVADQRSTDETRSSLVASPCRELLLTAEVRARAAELAAAHPELVEMLDRIAAGHAVDGMEALAPALVDGLELLVDVVPATTLVCVCDPELVRTRAQDLEATSQEFLQASWAAAAAGGEAPIDLGASAYRSLGDVRAHALDRGLGWWSLSPYAVAPDLAHEPLETDDGGYVDLSHIDVAGVAQRTVDARVVEEWMTGRPGVHGVHDLHIWSIHGTDAVLTAHVTVDEGLGFDDACSILCDMETGLADEFGVGHATLQLETPAHHAHERPRKI